LLRDAGQLDEGGHTGPPPPGVCAAPSTQTFSPSAASLGRHAVPQWFRDAKLGIFVHWGLYSVPAWAPVDHTFGDAVDATRAMTHNPYAEWYQNTMRLPGSPTQGYHNTTYGAIPYSAFTETFNQNLRGWAPDTWAALFRQSGARYVVLTAKHHEGFALWPSVTPHPHPEAALGKVTRDIVGELTAAVRATGLEMGLYYSGGLDWTVEAAIQRVKLHPPMPKTEAYAQYCDAHLRELMRWYRPSILWNDINYPARSKPKRLYTLFAEFYNTHCPQGLVNDRWGSGMYGFVGDYRTPEYSRVDAVAARPWELCRGIGRSFGHNRNEGEAQMMTVWELVVLLADVVAKNGNLLLDVGPDALGRIPPLQAERLRGLGAWVEVHGPAIHGTTPFLPAGAVPTSHVRYTCSARRVFCIMGHPPQQRQQLLSLPIHLQPNTTAYLLHPWVHLPWVASAVGVGPGAGVVLTPPASVLGPLPFVVVLEHPSLGPKEAVRVLVP